MIYIRCSKRLVPLSVLLALVCSCGCQNKSSLGPANVTEDEQITPTDKLIPAADSRLADVPTPLGAEFKAKSSSSYETGGRRTVKYNYGIWAKPILVRAFYSDNMPLRGWQLSNTITTQAVVTFSFKKAQEFCTVTIGPRNWCCQTQIRIEIQPMDDFRSTTSQGVSR